MKQSHKCNNYKTQYFTWKPFWEKTTKTVFYKFVDTNLLLQMFVGTKLLETLIPCVVCRHQRTRDTNPHYYL
jgi:hypothetical protein